MKNKLKWAFGLALVIICIVFGSYGLVVQAENQNGGNGDNNLKDNPYFKPPVRKCDQEVAKGAYKINVNAAYHANNNSFEIAISRGTFDIYVYETIYRNDGRVYTVALPSKTVLGVEGKGDNRVVAEISLPQDDSVPKFYDFVFKLAVSDKYCDVDYGATFHKEDNGTWVIDKGLGYIYSYNVEVPARTLQAEVKNVNFNGICAALRNGDYNSYKAIVDRLNSQLKDKNKAISIATSAEFNTYYSQALARVSYCTSPTVSFNYKEAQVAKLITNAIFGAKASEKRVVGEINGPPTTGEYTNVGQDESTDFSVDGKSLQCPAYKNASGLRLPNDTSTSKTYYKQVVETKNLDIYSSTGTTNDAQCIKTCEETVNVTYGPPVASKAGLCFEYKVKVESELNCKTEFIGEEPTPNDYQVCTPVGACNGRTFFSASGPNDDFDSCVNSCDGGKYTQGCIDSCYKDVYDTSSILPINYIDKLVEIETSKNSNVVKLATDEEMERYDAILKAAPLKGYADLIGPGKLYLFEDLQMAVLEAGRGYYSVSGGSIVWEVPRDARFWERPGRYYTVNITDYTVGRLRYIGRDSSSFAGQGGYSVLDNAGFLRNNAGSSYCGATCSWHGCDNARVNNYYDGYTRDEDTGEITHGIASNREFLNNEDAIDVYLSEFSAYKGAVESCAASATCTSQTSEFTIKVNNKTNDSEADNWIEYKSSIIPGGAQTATTVNGKSLGDTDKFSIILAQDGCYTDYSGKGLEGNTVKYLTEWSFPGTWINNKTGKISYQPQSGDGNAWHYKKEKFCTNLNSSFVNRQWWNQRILHPKENVLDSNIASIEEYNIQALAKNFGYFGWNFKVDCFYAINDGSFDDPGNGSGDDTKPFSFTLRSVDLKDVFPDNEKEDPTTDPNETGRAAGFNWTDGATNVKNSGYEVTPGALTSVIQARGNDIYADDGTYLDYEFILTPADLNKIRRYSNDVGSFNTFYGNISVKNGVAYYESPLFRSNSFNPNRLDPDRIGVLGALGVNNQARRDSNEAEVFTNQRVDELKKSREAYLKENGGNK